MSYETPRVPTRQLIADLVNQIADLTSIEARLMRAELSDSSTKAASGVGYLAGGFGILLAALVILLAGAASLLIRLGMPTDAACLIVAVGATAIGAILVAWGIRSLRPSNLAPVRSLNQVSTLIKGR
jgi:Putative Actinobacterial Holin-X, holin superfamily III